MLYNVMYVHQKRFSTSISQVMHNYLCRHPRVGSWVLVGGTAVFVGASYMPVEVDQLFSPHP